MKKSKTSQLAHWLRKMKQMKTRAQNDDGRSPSFHIFVIKAFEIIKTIRTFPFKKTVLNHQNFFIFPALKNFWFFAKNLAIRAKKSLIKTICCAFWKKIATFSDFIKIQAFHEKTHVCFEENPNFQRFEESRSKRQMCYKLVKKMKKREREYSNNWQTSGKNARFDWMSFLRYYIK